MRPCSRGFFGPPPPSIKKYVSPSFLVHTPVHGALAVLKHFALSLTIILPRFLIIPANGIVDIAFTVLYNMQDLSLSAVLLRIFLIFQNLILAIFIKKNEWRRRPPILVQNISSVTIEDFSLISET